MHLDAVNFFDRCHYSLGMSGIAGTDRDVTYFVLPLHPYYIHCAGITLLVGNGLPHFGPHSGFDFAGHAHGTAIADAWLDFIHALINYLYWIKFRTLNMLIN